MKVCLNNQIIERALKGAICEFCYFTKHNIDCFNFIYASLHGCILYSSYYKESDMDDSLFKL